MQKGDTPGGGGAEREREGGRRERERVGWCLQHKTMTKEQNSDGARWSYVRKSIERGGEWEGGQEDGADIDMWCNRRRMNWIYVDITGDFTGKVHHQTTVRQEQRQRSKMDQSDLNICRTVASAFVLIQQSSHG